MCTIKDLWNNFSTEIRTAKMNSQYNRIIEQFKIDITNAIEEDTLETLKATFTRNLRCETERENIEKYGDYKKFIVIEISDALKIESELDGLNLKPFCSLDNSLKDLKEKIEKVER